MGQIYDYLIVGGGLSGLFIAYKLLLLDKNLNKHPKILVLERDSEVGGNLDKLKYETIHPMLHPLTLDLLKQSGLFRQFIKDNKGLGYHLADKYYISSQEQDFPFPVEEMSPDEFILKAYQTKPNNIILHQYSTMEFLEQVVTPQQLAFLKATYPFWSLLYSCNAEEGEALVRQRPLISRDYRLRSHSQLVKRYLVKQLTKLGCQIKTHRKVTVLNESHELTQVIADKIMKPSQKLGGRKKVLKSTSSYYSKIAILAIPPWEVKRLNTLEFVDNCSQLLSSLVTVPTCSVFLTFPKKGGKYWFSGLPYITTGKHLNYFGPICHQNGVFLASYTEGQQTIPIFEANLEGSLFRYLRRQLKSLFPEKTIPKPVNYQIIYQKRGKTLIGAGIDTGIVKPLLSKPTSLPIYLVGNSYAQQENCLEGSLQTALKVFLEINQEREPIKSEQLDSNYLDIEMVEAGEIEGENDTDREGEGESVGREDQDLNVLDNPVIQMDIMKAEVDGEKDVTDDKPINSPREKGSCLATLAKQDSLKEITLQELNSHHTEENAWIGLFGYIYNITEWLQKPGNQKYRPCLLNGLGQDFSRQFQDLLDHPKQYGISEGSLSDFQNSLVKTMVGKLKY